MRPTESTQASILRAPPLVDHRYAAIVVPGDREGLGPMIVMERGELKCAPLVQAIAMSQNPSAAISKPSDTCTPEIAKLIGENKGVVFIVDQSGPRWLSREEVIAAAVPIDTPSKALLAVWAEQRYSADWTDGAHVYGTWESGVVRAADGGFEVVAGTDERKANCGGTKPSETVTYHRVVLRVDVDGRVTLREDAISYVQEVADPCHPHGRRPANFSDVAGGDSVVGQLRRATHHEAESVRAFERIARELRAHGALRELCEAADAAAMDEREHAERHARLVGSLTGAEWETRISRDDLPVRSMLELALDNVREGCVGESYAALAMVRQAREAATPELRDHYAAIAPDEIEHAALAHAIDAWLDTRLDDEERALVREARDRALRELDASFDLPTTHALHTLGVPTGHAARYLLASVARQSGLSRRAERRTCGWRRAAQ